MREITVRELRNRGGDVLERVARGEALTVTRDGQAIAELRPLRRRPIPAAVLVNRWRQLPAVDPARLRADIDELLDGFLVDGTDYPAHPRGIGHQHRDPAAARH